MTKLQTLNLASSGLNATTVGTLLPSICALPTLYELYLNDNTLFFEGALLLFEKFSGLQQLKRLSLAQTMFDRAVVPDIPGTPLHVLRIHCLPEPVVVAPIP